MIHVCMMTHTVCEIYVMIQVCIKLYLITSQSIEFNATYNAN